MLKGFYTFLLLVLSNLFMNFAWYGHLQFQKWGWIKSEALPVLILLSWGIALFEYVLQVPANRLGYVQNGGPYSMVELKTIQECLSLGVFSLYSPGVAEEIERNCLFLPQSSVIFSVFLFFPHRHHQCPQLANSFSFLLLRPCGHLHQ